MFLESSRYHKLKTVDVPTRDGRTVKAVTLRNLPNVNGTPTIIEGDSRLDIIAQRRYNDPGRFWHIADANTELQAHDLVKEAGQEIDIPEQ